MLPFLHLFMWNCDLSNLIQNAGQPSVLHWYFLLQVEIYWVFLAELATVDVLLHMSFIFYIHSLKIYWVLHSQGLLIHSLALKRFDKHCYYFQCYFPFFQNKESIKLCCILNILFLREGFFLNDYEKLYWNIVSYLKVWR